MIKSIRRLITQVFFLNRFTFGISDLTGDSDVSERSDVCHQYLTFVTNIRHQHYCNE